MHPLSHFVLELHEFCFGWFCAGHLGEPKSTRVLSNGKTELQPWSFGAISYMWYLRLNPHKSKLLLGGQLVHNMWKIQYHALDGEECVAIYNTRGNNVDSLVLQLGVDSIKHYRKDGQASGSEVIGLFDGTPPGDVVLSLVVEGCTFIKADSNRTSHGGAVVACYSLGGAMVCWLVGRLVSAVDVGLAGGLVRFGRNT